MKQAKSRRKPKFPHPSPSLSHTTQTGLISQAGAGNSQTIHLTLINQLHACQACTHALEQLVASQAETIALLRAIQLAAA